MSQARLLREVEKRLNRKIPAAIWEHLVSERYVSEALGGEIDDPVDWLARNAQKFLNLSETQEAAKPLLPDRRQRQMKERPLRLQVISELVAGRARKDRKLKWFRSTFMASGLIEPAGVVDWVFRNQETARFEHAVIVNLPKTVTLDHGINGWECNPPLSRADFEIENPVPQILLDFSVPDNEWVHRVPIGRDGVLRSLANIADALASTYSWQKAQATMFVLTDRAPLLSPNEVAVKQAPFLEFGPGGLRSIQCLSRFILTIDPRSSPREVARLYKRARAKHLRPSRAISEKHMTLAGFAAQHDEISRSVMESWNQERPRWRYTRYSLFARDVRTATKRLLFGSSIDPRTLRPGVPTNLSSIGSDTPA